MFVQTYMGWILLQTCSRKSFHLPLTFTFYLEQKLNYIYRHLIELVWQWSASRSQDHCSRRLEIISNGHLEAKGCKNTWFPNIFQPGHIQALLVDEQIVCIILQPFVTEPLILPVLKELAFHRIQLVQDI